MADEPTGSETPVVEAKIDTNVENSEITAVEQPAAIVEKDLVPVDLELKNSVILPEYLQHAIRVAVEGNESLENVLEGKSEDDVAPASPILVFYNSKSGGGIGPTLNVLLNQLIGSAQVFDLSAVKPLAIISSVLKLLQELSDKGDSIAEDSLNRLRILVAGGDGTAGWLLSTVAQIDTKLVPPVGIIPLGTGNDLARSFGWGPGFSSPTLASVKKKLLDSAGAEVAKLDAWRISVVPPAGSDIEQLSKGVPHAMAKVHTGEGAESADPNAFQASFYNYVSIGMDAQIAYGFHHLREDKPWLFTGGSVNKVIYSGFSCAQGWFCAACSPQPQRSAVSGVATIFIKRTSESEWEELYIPHTMRSVIVLNLQSYAGGRDLWGTPSQKQNEKNGWVPAGVADGLLEIVGLYEGWHVMLALSSVLSAKHLAQAAAVKFELRGSQAKQAYMQLDGEPWLQPLEDPRDATVVEISKIPTPSLLLAGASASVLKTQK